MKLHKIKIKGIDVRYLQVQKYKHILVSFSFYNLNKKNDYNERNLIPSLLENNNRIYKTSDQLNVAMDMLYGADFFSGTYQRGHLFSNQFHLKLVNPKYLHEEEDILARGFKLMHDVIFKPKMYGQLLTKKAVEDKIKEAKDAMHTIKQDKATLAYFNFLKKVTGKGLPSFFPYEPTFQQMSQASFTRVYNEMINNDQLKIFVVGDFEISKLNQIIDGCFDKERSQIDIKNVPLNQNIEHDDMVHHARDFDEVSISRLYLGYHLHVERHSKKEMMMEVLNKIIGGDAQSKLFRNIREEAQMVYMIYSAYLSEIDLMMIHFETEAKDEDEAIRRAKMIIEDVQSGYIADDEINMAKKSLIKTYKSISDKLFGLVKLHMNEEIMTDKPFDLNTRIETIQSITKEDLVGLANELTYQHEYRFVKEAISDE